MQLKHLSSQETKLIKKITSLIVESYITNYHKGDPIFDQFIEEFGEILEDANMSGIANEITDEILIMEAVKENPKAMSELEPYHLNLIKVILLEILNPEYKPITKRKLLKKIEVLIHHKFQSLN